jgi:hypothetical protein
MNRIILVLLAISLSNTLFAIDLSTQKKIFETENFIFYAEDSNNYTELIELCEQKNKEFEIIFEKIIDQKITIYIFSNQISFSRKVFNSDSPVQNATGLADHVSMRFYITSFYDTCKTKERLLQTPVHELVHLYFPSKYVWIREGIACYYSNMLTKFSSEDLPRNFSEIHFYSHGATETEIAYNSSAWIIKYILEELLDNNLSQFRNFAANPVDYSSLGFNEEIDFFDSWRQYMLLQD